MNFSTLNLCLLFFVVHATTVAQNSQDISLEWELPKSLSVAEEDVNVLSFKGAYYHLSEHTFPIFRKKIRLPENVDRVDVQVEVLEKSFFLPEEKDLKKRIVPDLSLTWRISYERKIPYLIFSYIPIDADFKVNRFKYSLNLTYKDYDIQFRSALTNSVLAHGDWYKIKVSHDGLYKIDKDFLADMGLNVSEIDPRKIQIYGNGGAMLPEYNATFRHDDLVENAIYVKGQDDGSFDSGDIVVFYGESPHRWELDSENAFKHIQNIYDDHNYYFLHVGDENGKRITTIENSLDEDIEVDFYTDRQFYEWEDQNLKHTGRQWFGEYFSFDEQYNINFNFQDRIKTEPVRINARAVARSTSSTSLECMHNGAEVLNVPIGTQVNSSVYVDDGESFAEFTSMDHVLDINVSYNRNGNSSAFAYLDYIELQAKCELKYDGGQLIFREPSTVGVGHVTKFNLTSSKNSLEVWDVTDPADIKGLFVDETLSFISSTDSLKTFVIHDLNNASYLNPVFDAKIENQNLHGHEPVELLIITAPEFLQAAERLAEFHVQEDGMTVNVATTHQIYNEFSSGKQDLVALRSYIRMLYDKAEIEDEIPDNVLLFGDASFDYKGIGAANDRYTDQNFVPTFQSEYSFRLGQSYCTDDFLTYLDSLEGSRSTMSSDGMDIGLGRLVVQSVSEAEDMVDKIKSYHSVNSFGDWRSNICFVADDIDEDWEFRLQENIDKIAQDVDTNYHNYNINKIYLDAYQQVSSSGGQRYPDARQAIIDNVNKGALIMHYYGHGGEVGWAEERVLELFDINSWENKHNLPVFVTATCEFSRYDDAKRVSAGEQVLLNPKGAGIALFTTTRTITETDARNLSRSFYKYAIPESAGEVLTFGQIMKCIKNDLNSSSISTTNKMKFALLGDPALKLPVPQLSIVVNEVLNADTDEQIDTIHALSKVRVKGAVLSEAGTVLDSFNGLLKPKVFDKPLQLQTLNNDFEHLEPFHFDLQQSVLYSGNVTVENGLFEFEFVVPQDIAYADGFGKFSFYAYNESQDAIGSFADIVIGGFDENTEADQEGPVVELYMNNTDFRYGGITDANPGLFAVIRDESGINTTGNGIGHDIVATLDEDSQSSVVLNHYYESDLDSYQSGVVVYPYSDLEEGVHHLKIKVWDVHNNSSEAFTEFVVVSDDGLILNNLMNYPNPFSDFTRIHFEHNRPGDALDVRLEIYDMNGKLVKSVSNTISESSYANSDLTWNGASDNGTSVKSGIYLCRLIVSSQELERESVISSQMILIK
jgi:hypothetical protein